MEVSLVELRILGNTELSVAGDRTGSFVLRQPKRLALLAYLALATAGGYRRRDQIVALFWPDLDQAHSRTQLRKVLHALRSTLGGEAFVNRGEEELRLDAKRVWCDAVAFPELVRNGQWAEALALYRGDLLEGLFPGGVGEQFETWLGDQRSALREQAARAAWECSTREDLAGRRGEAIALARRALDLDPDDEEAVRRLIALLDRYGDRAGAMRLFDDWQVRMRTDYGADPAPETRKLARKVRAPRQGDSLETPPSLLSEPAELVGSMPAPEASGVPNSAELSKRHHPTGAFKLGLVALTVIGVLAAVGIVRRDFCVEILHGICSQATVAVLPLRGLGHSSDSPIGDGVPEELTTAFAQLPGITVRSTARSREAVYAGGDVRRIGRRLAVGLVLDGSIQHGAGRSRVTLRLVRVADAVTVWARAFDMNPENLLAEQERIARAVVDEIGPRLVAFAHGP